MSHTYPDDTDFAFILHKLSTADWKLSRGESKIEIDRESIAKEMGFVIEGHFVCTQQGYKYTVVRWDTACQILQAVKHRAEEGFIPLLFIENKDEFISGLNQYLRDELANRFKIHDLESLCNKTVRTDRLSYLESLSDFDKEK